MTDLHLFVEDWVAEPVVVAPPRPSRCALVFVSDPGTGRALRRRLLADQPGLTVVTVARGDGFARLASDRYQAGGATPAELAESYGTVLSAVTAEHGPVDVILHLWATEDPALLWEPAPVAVLLQSMVRHDVLPARVVLGGAYRDGLERCAAESWLGYERSTAIVLPGTTLTTLSVDTVDDLPDIVAKELLAARPSGAWHAGGIRYVPKVRAAEPATATADVVRHGGTYLITGGMGGLGAIFARWLARDYGARLVLVGRREPDDTVAARIAELETLGATVLYRRADVCDEPALAAAVEAAAERFGRIDGVLHAAGVQRRGNLADRDLATITEILGPKITGTVNLERALSRVTPDFVCYFSSSAAVLGDFGSCDYASGNRFQLAYARHLAERNPSGPRRLAVCWPLWDSDGMGLADDAATEFYLRSSGLRLLGADEGTALLSDLLGRSGTHYLALAGDATRINAMLEVEEPMPSVAGSLDRLLGEVVSRILRLPVEQLPVDENFQEFGFDSLSLVEFAGVLSERLGVEVTPDLFFSYTTLRSLSGYLRDRHADRLAAVFGASAGQAEPAGVRRRTGRANGNRFAGGRPAPATAVVAEPSLDALLGEIVSRILRIPVEQLPVDENFQEFGFDSLSLVEFAGVLSERLGVDVTPDLFFSYTTLRSLSGYLRDRLAGEPVAEVAAPARRGVVRRTRPADGNRFSAGRKGPGAGEPIAIIGMSGRFASARTVDELWDLLLAGRSAIGTVPAGRDPSWADGKDRTMAWLPGIAEFDPRFFGIAPSDAETIDPRQRLLLEEMWKALEDAGFGAEQVRAERVGVFVGVEEGDYRLLAAGQEAITANHNAVLAARLSYFLDLTGPGIAINTACSSSLVALHEACLSLRNGDCDTAIVAGANLMATPREYDAMDGAGMLSPSGACRAFDRRADGMVAGEAVVAVVLKARSAAERDGHPIHASVLATGVNNDGRTNGITAPSGLAQTRLLTDVYRRAGVSPSAVGHIVAHGTGTRLGDPVEINALAEAFGPDAARPGTCALTSTKPNIGHSQAASGLASVVAMALAMRHETIPPSIHCEEISDFVGWRRSPFFVNREARHWPEPVRGRRYGGVSAFGFSGTNAHAVLESHGTARQDLDRLGAQPVSTEYLLLCSARTEQALSTQLRALADRLESLAAAGPGVMSSVSYTLIAGRHHFARRCALVVPDRADAVAALRAAADGAVREGIVRGAVPRDFEPDSVAGEDLYAMARAYCQGHDPASLTGLWARPPERMSLPTYEFDHADYWVTATPEPVRGRLHPLVHRNVSDVTGLRFASDFTGAEEWFADGTMTRGAALELAAAAASEALGHPATLDDVTWHDVISVADNGCTTRVDLRVAGESTVDWALYASAGADEPRLVASGSAAHQEQAPEVVEQGRVPVPAGTGRKPEMRGWTVPECLAWELADAAGTVLKIPAAQLDPDENLANFGFNSLNIASYATELTARLDFRITPDTFFNHPTLARLATHLTEERGERIAAWYREETAAEPVRVPVKRKQRLDTAAPAFGTRDEPIAIVGMSGRFPDARSIEDLWSILVEGRTVIREVPEDRLPFWGTEGDRRFGAIPGVAEFDPLFFEIAPREAELMDPRQRLLLQEMWHALEDAGYGDRATNGEKVGIFVGAEEGDYRYLADNTEGVGTANNALLAARLAYFLNLTGPSMSINTSCSSGLVALHEACLSLRHGDCDTAIVAAASVLSSAHDYVSMEKAGMLSPDRTVYAFDRRANGMVPGEAVAVLVLRKKRAAERAGSRVHATILGTGINYDGRTNGITAPSGDAQATLLRAVHERYGIAPESVGYVAAHGTGTRLGDPIEVNALADAFRARTDRTGFCALTSIKPNVGHSMAASGLVSLIGVVMAMRNETIPPSINCAERSDYIDWDTSPFFVNREARAWPADGPRRAAVSAFGMSGTNAHVVVESAAPPPAAPRPLPHHLLLVSAKTEEALALRLTGLADHLEARDEHLASVSRTLMTGRHHFAHRRALVVADRADAVRLLRAAATDAKEPGLYRGTVSRDFVANATIEQTVTGIARSAATLHDDGAACRDHLRALAEFYCQGHFPAFDAMWPSLPPLVGLPPYPFAAEHHWVAATQPPTSARPQHPLVQEHTSDGTVHRFRTQFTGGEAVLSDLLVPANPAR